MPLTKAINRAKQAKKEGKAPSTQAGEFVRQQMDELHEGKGRAKNPKQAIAIGLSEARREGVNIPPPPGKTAAKKKSGAKKTATAKKAAGTKKAASAKKKAAPKKAASRKR